MKNVLFLLIALALLSPASLFAEKKNVDITGTYDVKGFNPGTKTCDDPSYTGKLQISQSGGAYILDWKLDNKKNYKGAGILTDNVLSANTKDGIVSYRIEDGLLRGVWAPSTGGKFGFEEGKRASRK